MDKKKKFWAIALIAILVAVLAFVIVYWALNGKEETIALFGRVKDFINQPLPIIGFSLVTLAVIAFKFVSMSSWGRKAVEDAKKEFEDFKAKQEEEKAKEREALELYKKDLEDEVSKILANQGIGDANLGKVESFIKGLPFKGAKDFRLDHKEEGE